MINPLYVVVGTIDDGATNIIADISYLARRSTP